MYSSCPAAQTPRPARTMTYGADSSRNGASHSRNAAHSSIVACLYRSVHQNGNSQGAMGTPVSRRNARMGSTLETTVTARKPGTNAKRGLPAHLQKLRAARRQAILPSAMAQPPFDQQPVGRARQRRIQQEQPAGVQERGLP